jgi:hypothetical protein
VVAEQRIRRVPLERELQARVVARAGEARREHLVERRVAVAPEGRAPRLDEVLDGREAGAQPVLERGGGLVAVVVRVLVAELVADVPHPQRRVLAVALGHPLDEPQRVAAEDLRRRRPREPAPLREPHPRVGDARDLGVRPHQPDGRRGGGGGEVHADPALVQQVHDPVEPAEVELAVGHLDEAPGEDAEVDRVDARAAHELDVLDPHLLGPLLGAVVAAEGEPVGDGREGGARREVQGAGADACHVFAFEACGAASGPDADGGGAADVSAAPGCGRVSP